MLLRPSCIHPKQHLPPVLGLGTTGTRMQLKNRIELVIRLVQEQLKLELFQTLQQRFYGLGNLRE
ncbi:hypothetical protein D3C81_2171470 [compost metagenome]